MAAIPSSDKRIGFVAREPDFSVAVVTLSATTNAALPGIIDCARELAKNSFLDVASVPV